jgi:hypothetical protein
MTFTCVHTPRFCGDPLERVTLPFSAFRVKRSAGALVRFCFALRPFRTSWLIVGN